MGLFKNLVSKLANVKEFDFSVAGVTFKNGRRSRQTILRAMKYGDPPYDKVEITLKKTTFDGKPAIEVWANQELIGFVPKDVVPDIMAAWQNEYMVTGWEIVGGDDVSYGCRVKVMIR